MKYSKATNYALHTIVYLALLPSGKTIGVKHLAVSDWHYTGLF
ncbi:Rrf2 family transcriptional regulator [Metabacillus halosaccharovorans]|nr:Rrf2 family transcriptional regulator [Metabacillus halosaccharovorans]